jgi:transposase
VSTAYFVLIREMRRLQHGLRLAQSARQQGITPTARLFQTTVPTLRKWLRRYQEQGPRGLLELSRDPHHEPGKTPADIEQQVVTLRQKLFTFGARRLIREFDLPLSHRALERIWRQHGLLKKRQRQISAQTRPRPYQGHLARLSADLR